MIDLYTNHLGRFLIMINLILFPSSYFNRKQVDENLKQEYEAVLSTKLFDVQLFDNKKWFDENKLILSSTSDELRLAIYRGWMMKPDEYKIFYESLLMKNIKLINEPRQYELMHIFPNVYEYLKEDTAKILTFPLKEEIDINLVKNNFRKFIVKDFVKSVKNTSFPSYFDNSITQNDFNHWMDIFYKYRGNLLTGGICIKEFLYLKRYNQTNEYRVFYINHKIATISRNSGQGIYVPLPPQEMLEKYIHLNSLYYTIDYAELENGDWKIIETGDGQVSGLSDSQDYEEYYKILYSCFNS